jgi:tRNA threonylcarbamoyl adenosine modification protein YeaZ
VLVLGLDTSSPAIGVACVELEPDPDGGPAASWGRQADWRVVDARAHGELLATGIRAVLAELGAVPRDLGAVAVGLGPGPFTGLRVGVVTAAALSDALGVPAYGCCSLDAVDPWGEGERVVVTDARRKEVYWAEYAADDERVAGPSVLRPAALAEALAEVGWTGRVLGDGALASPELFPGVPPEPRYPSAEGVVLLAARRALSGAPPEPLVPLYLRRPDATPPVPTPPPGR